MNTKAHCKITTLVLLAILAAAGCSLFGGGATGTVRSYFRYTEENKPEEMVKLFSEGYLIRNKNALADCRDFIKFMEQPIKEGKKIVLSDISETKSGEMALVKGNYGVTGSELKRAFEARLVKENNEWKLDDLKMK